MGFRPFLAAIMQQTLCLEPVFAAHLRQRWPLRCPALPAPPTELIVSLLRQYVDRAASAVANQAWTDITDAGLDQVCFGWAGPLERGAGHYYALSGPGLLIEYDNTQDRANHIYSVWRDLRRDLPR
jgi:hypothetical protein